MLTKEFDSINYKLGIEYLEPKGF